MKIRWESSGYNAEQSSSDLEESKKTEWDFLSDYKRRQEIQKIFDSIDQNADPELLREIRNEREKNKQRDGSEIEPHYDADVGPHPEGTEAIRMDSSEPEPEPEPEQELLRDLGVLTEELDDGVENGEDSGATREERFGQTAINAAVKQSESPIERGINDAQKEQEPSDEERLSAAMEYIRTNGTFPEGLDFQDRVKLSMECFCGGANVGRQINVELTPEEEAARDERIREVTDYCFKNGKLPDGLGDGTRVSLSYRYGLENGKLPDGLSEDERIKTGLFYRLNEGYYFNDFSSEELTKIEERVNGMWNYYKANGKMSPELGYMERVGFAVDYYWWMGKLPDGLDNDELSSARSLAEKAVSIAKELLNNSGEIPEGLNQHDRLDIAKEYTIKNSAVPRGLDPVETEKVVTLAMNESGKLPEGLNMKDRLDFATRYAIENNKTLQGLSLEEETSVARAVMFRESAIPDFVDNAMRMSLASEYVERKFSLPRGLSAKEELSLAREFSVEGEKSNFRIDRIEEKNKMLTLAAYDYCKEYGRLPDGLGAQICLDAAWRYYINIGKVPVNLGWNEMLTIIKRIGAEGGNMPKNLGENGRMAIAAELSIGLGPADERKRLYLGMFGAKTLNNANQYLRDKRESCFQTGEMPTRIGPGVRMEIAKEYCYRKNMLPDGLRMNEKKKVLEYCFRNKISLSGLSDEDKRLMVQWENGA